MKQAVLSNFDLPWLPLTGLILFVVCFAIYTYWTFKKENKPVYDQASLIPLEEPARASLGKGGN
jgi:cbb3-type cytochrome oxidase subunit 3